MDLRQREKQMVPSYDQERGRLADVTACPGTDSCKLGITSSRGLAAQLRENFSNGM